MKSLKQHLHLLSSHSTTPPIPQYLFLFPLPFASLPFSSSTDNQPPSAASETSTTSTITLTQSEITKINLLIPRLCLSDNLPTAIHLINTAILANPPLQSLSLPILTHSLASQPDMTQSMSLLTRLRYNPFGHLYLTPINTMLISSYFKNHKTKEAFKVFNWMMRPDSPCKPDVAAFRVLVCGFCKKGMIIEDLKVLRAMVCFNLVPGRDLRIWTYRGLLKEARIKEAMELNEAMGMVADDEDNEDLMKVLVVLDHIINNWTD